MTTEVSSGVKVGVESIFRKDLSNVKNGLYFFNYRVVIENQNIYDVQLKARNWFVFDSLNPSRNISGDGVVGRKPVLKPGQKYVYLSGCDLYSEIGYMSGFYEFVRTDNGEKFNVQIPRFILFAKTKMN